MIDSSVLGQIIGGLCGIGGMAYAAKTSIKANQRQRTADDRSAAAAVEAGAFERARRIYDDAIQKLEKELIYLNTQVDRIRAQLAGEQNVSDALRMRVRELEQHFEQRTDPLSELRRATKQNGGL